MFLQVSLDKTLKLYKVSETEMLLHGARITLSYIGGIGLVGMIVSMKVLGKKDFSSAFELMMSASFMGFIGSFANQLSHVQITISASLSEGLTGKQELDIGTELVCDFPVDEDENNGNSGDSGGSGDDFSFPENWDNYLINNEDEDADGNEENRERSGSIGGRRRTYSISKVVKIPIGKKGVYGVSYDCQLTQLPCLTNSHLHLNNR